MNFLELFGAIFIAIGITAVLGFVLFMGDGGFEESKRMRSKIGKKVLIGCDSIPIVDYEFSDKFILENGLIIDSEQFYKHE